MVKAGDEVLNQFQQEKDEPVGVKSARKLKIGIIGTGWIAESHVKSYKNMADVEIVAGADLIPGKAEAFFKKYGVAGVRCYPDHKSMLDAEQLDAVSVCTYNATHAVCTIDALKKGVHVLLEKPMCVTLEEAVDIVRAEKQSGKILSIGFQPRFDANMQMIKHIVESGELGEVYYIQTGGGRRRGIPNSTFIEKKTAGIGALGDIGCYSLDMVLNAIGYPRPLTVSAYTSDFFGKSYAYSLPENACRFSVDDFAAAFIRLEAALSWISGFPGRCIWIRRAIRSSSEKRPACAYPRPTAGTAPSAGRWFCTMMWPANRWKPSSRSSKTKVPASLTRKSARSSTRS